MEKHSYNIHVIWNKDRRGTVCSPELARGEDRNCIEVATPPEFPKGIPGVWSPEHLFTAAISSCFMTTFLAVAENSNFQFTHFECMSEGILEDVNGRPELTEVIVRPLVSVKEQDRDHALRVLKKAESVCIISHAVRANIVVVPALMTREG